ncbi:MAG: guanylate kinase [Armatimonadota bacterium]|jgi:guanylate kinase
MRIWEEYAQNGGLLFVLSGPSGVGKDTVFKKFLTLGADVKKSISCTTRSDRGNEVNGVDYFFLTTDEFIQRQARGFFLESALYNGDWYGTPREWVEQQNSQGNDVMLVIEIQGAGEIKRQRPDSVAVFIVPPSMEELERRLRDRATDSESSIKTRLATATEELQFVSKYDYVIENDTVEKAAQELKAIVIAERNKVKRDPKRL